MKQLKALLAAAVFSCILNADLGGFTLDRLMSIINLTDERGRWLLGPHPEARSEYRIRTPERSYVIDRVFRESSGLRWVVDYKTSGHEGTDIENFLDRERQRYAH